MGCLWSKHFEAPVSTPAIPEVDHINSGYEQQSFLLFFVVLSRKVFHVALASPTVSSVLNEHKLEVIFSLDWRP